MSARSARQHINIGALENGYLTEIAVNEGQAVKKGDLLFKITPVLEKGQAPSADIKAPFDGILDRLQQHVGSLVKEGDTLTTLSDNSTIWVYFNVPENRYLEYMANRKLDQESKIELMLTNGTIFPQPGKIAAIEAKFNNETGTIAFRADFPNPDGLLRHGQSGTIVMHRKLHDAIVVPIRATLATRDKRYVHVVDKDGVAHLREIVAEHELDDVYVIKKGVGVGDRIVLDGVRKVRDGEKVDYELRVSDEVMRRLKKRAE